MSLGLEEHLLLGALKHLLIAPCYFSITKRKNQCSYRRLRRRGLAEALPLPDWEVALVSAGCAVEASSRI